jgi:transcriptional regulator with XRE-family HTH domain
MLILFVGYRNLFYEVINILGKKIKEARERMGLSIKDLATKVDVSSSLLSQIERDLANPSLNTLRSIAAQLEVPMFSFFEESKTSETMIVRHDERIRIINGKNNSKEIDQGYDLLSPDLKGVIQMCEMSLGPNQYNSDKFNRHEVAVCTEESIELHLENKVILLDKGDSVRIVAGTPHKWRNPSDKKCAIIFAMSPPTF